MIGETHVSHFLRADLILYASALLVPYFTKPLGESVRMFQIRSFEPHAHQSDELQWRLTSREAVPEPIAHREAAQLETFRFDALLIEPHVTHFIRSKLTKTAPELGVGVWESENRPAKKLCCLEFMVPKLVVQFRTGLRSHECFGLPIPGAVPHYDELRWASRTIGCTRLSGEPIGDWLGVALGPKTGAANVVARPLFDGGKRRGLSRWERRGVVSTGRSPFHHGAWHDSFSGGRFATTVWIRQSLCQFGGSLGCFGIKWIAGDDALEILSRRLLVA